jgi:hypothetical protein
MRWDFGSLGSTGTSGVRNIFLGAGKTTPLHSSLAVQILLDTSKHSYVLRNTVLKFNDGRG